MTVPEFIIFFLISGCIVVNLYRLFMIEKKLDWLQEDAATALERIRERLRKLEGSP